MAQRLSIIPYVLWQKGWTGVHGSGRDNGWVRALSATSDISQSQFVFISADLYHRQQAGMPRWEQGTKNTGLYNRLRAAACFKASFTFVGMMRNCSPGECCIQASCRPYMADTLPKSHYHTRTQQWRVTRLATHHAVLKWLSLVAEWEMSLPEAGLGTASLHDSDDDG